MTQFYKGLNAEQVSDVIRDMSTDDVFSVTKGKKKDNPTHLFGRFGLMQKGNNDAMDAREVFKELSPAANWLIWEMDLNKNVLTNTVNMSPTKVPVSEKAKYYRGVKELEDKHLIVKVKRGEYLINPFALFPWNDEIEKVRERWRSLTNKDKTTETDTLINPAD